MENCEGLIEDCRLAQTTLCDTTLIDVELTKFQEEIEIVVEFSRKAIYENAQTGLNQDEFNERNNRYVERYHQVRARIEFLKLEKQRLIAKSKILEKFIGDIKNRPLVINEWDKSLWFAVIDRVVVNLDETLTFIFRNGSEVTFKIYQRTQNPPYYMFRQEKQSIERDNLHNLLMTNTLVLLNLLI